MARKVLERRSPRHYHEPLLFVTPPPPHPPPPLLNFFLVEVYYTLTLSLFALVLSPHTIETIQTYSYEEENHGGRSA